MNGMKSARTTGSGVKKNRIIVQDAWVAPMKKKFAFSGLKRGPKLLFLASGIISTLWFLFRVIPKPSRATYPCMRVAAPLMSGFVAYLLSLGGLAVFVRYARRNFLRSRYIIAACLVFAALIFAGIFLLQSSPDSFATELSRSGPDDGPNQPMGSGQGVFPGRVVWVWNPKATNSECLNVFDFCRPENTNQGVVNKMLVDAVLKLGGDPNLNKSWDALFRSFNFKKSQVEKGYSPGESFFIKVNQGTANGYLRNIGRNGGFDVPERVSKSQKAQSGLVGTCETYPSVVLEILRELVYVVGVDQRDISIGDPMSHIYNYNYEVWATEFPDVLYVDRATSSHGRTRIHPTEKDLLFYSDKTQRDKLYDVIEDADYLINVANLKPHGRAGISLTAKNHFGTHASRSSYHLHYSLISPVSVGNPSNGGYGKYRAMVDMMGSKYLGRNTLLYVVDALYGGGSLETRVPVKYFMPPFNNDWSNSVFLSQDQVALESVCYDFLRTEWNGTYAHSSANNAFESMPNANGVDDYLHQAADPSNWPTGITYDPDQSGQALGSLGVHEHWNNAGQKQYSRNLGLPRGIELISVPEGLVGGNGPAISESKDWLAKAPVSVDQEDEAESSSGTRSTLKVLSVEEAGFDGVFKAKKFYSLTVDTENRRWFLCDAGIVSFDGNKWSIHNQNRKISDSELKDVAYDYSDFGDELWFATSTGATVASIPIDARSGATTYYSGNSPISSENVASVVVGHGSLRWFGTDKGISAFYKDKWLTSAYQRKYPEYMFADFPITAMATSPDGDSLYVGTMGAGVTRVFRNDVDAISGASEYAQWGPIELPSDTIYSIWITRNGTQWFGTAAGAARHVGYNTIDDWTVFNKENGLIDNKVQAIAADYYGRVWFGTEKGVSVYDHVSMSSFTEEDGLTSNNILFISVDHEGLVWLGTDKGLTSYSNGVFTKYTD